MLGVQAFLAGHPLAQRIGLILNFEARGNRRTHAPVPDEPLQRRADPGARGGRDGADRWTRRSARSTA